MKRLPTKAACYGCGACAQACAASCIRMTENDEGFLHPLVDARKCLHCGRCERVCPRLKKTAVAERRDAYAAYAADRALRCQSSSGALFALLAAEILRLGGVVFGAAFDADFSVHHIAVENEAELFKLKGSKYVQSRIENSYAAAREALKTRRVLFSGTACQIAGLKAFLACDPENLYTVDILCHGAPSPKVWRKYLEARTKQAGACAKRVNFRDKSVSWAKYGVRMDFDGGAAYQRAFSEDPYMRLFLSDIDLRRSCYQCGYRGVDRPGDITLGDFWGVEKAAPEMNNEAGCSAVLVHSDKGAALLKALGGQLRIKPVQASDIAAGQEQTFYNVPPSFKRKVFFRRLEHAALEDLLALIRPSILYRIRRKGVKIWHRIARGCAARMKKNQERLPNGG